MLLNCAQTSTGFLNTLMKEATTRKRGMAVSNILTHL